MTNDAISPPRLLRRPEVEARVGLTRSTLYSLISRGLFPRPVPVSPGSRSVAWVEEEVTAYIRACIAERGAKPAGRDQ